MSFELLKLDQSMANKNKPPKAWISLTQSGVYINNVMIQKIKHYLNFDPTYLQVYLDREKQQVALCFLCKKESQSRKIQIKKQKNGNSWYATYNKKSRDAIINILNTTKINDFDCQIIDHKVLFILKQNERSKF